MSKIAISDIREARKNGAWGTKSYENTIDLIIDKMEELEKRINNKKCKCKCKTVYYSSSGNL